MTRIARLFALALLAGCATLPERAAPVADGSSVSLGVGQSAQLADGSQIDYTQLVNDSRCPPDVQCVWAGDAEIALQWRAADGTTRALRLHTNGQAGPSATRAGDRTVTLTALERGDAPTATLRIDRTD